ncbi:hypothetical protein GOL96_32855 [Sinorhizobium medicae]|nr:hypothetical protein [Sinorhizobium medicae]MDX1238388.1 hypothetical protein [Sinorhizobium medicae]
MLHEDRDGLTIWQHGTYHKTPLWAARLKLDSDMQSELNRAGNELVDTRLSIGSVSTHIGFDLLRYPTDKTSGQIPTVTGSGDVFDVMLQGSNANNLTLCG